MLRVVAALALAFAAVATPAAASVKLGRLDPNPSSGSRTEAAPDGSRYHGCDYVGALYVPGQPDGQWLPGATGNPDTSVPRGGGVLTSWTIADEPAGSVFRLAVTRFDSQGAVIVARSAAETVARGGAAETFRTRIPVSGGEQIALDAVSVSGAGDDCFYWDGNGNDCVYTFGDDHPDGAQTMWMPGVCYRWRRVNLEATLDRSAGRLHRRCARNHRRGCRHRRRTG